MERVKPSQQNISKQPAGRSALDQLENYRKQIRQIDHITGTEKKPVENHSDPCDLVSSLQLRNARVGKNLMACQSMDDVEHIYGTPDSVSTWSKRKAYDTRWLYRLDDDSRIYVFFKDGLVTKWNSHSY